MNIFFYIQIENSVVIVAEADNVRQYSKEVDFSENSIIFKTHPAKYWCEHYESSSEDDPEDEEFFIYTFWLEDSEATILDIKKKDWSRVLIKELFKRTEK